ncbi:MAG: glycoside hydrolase family 15 protein [Bacteroidales bacterium]|nr:glycoside hydrolase family 15 protein [Bacteroidales bacterium]
MDNLNYGIVGNCRSAALISSKGSVDWMCLPDFDDPSVFAKLLDEKKGGSFEIVVDDTYDIFQSYKPKTNILITRFKSGLDIFEVHDFMPRYMSEGETVYAPSDLIRYIKYVSGNPAFRVKYDPRLEYAKYETKHVVWPKYIKSYVEDGVYDSLYLYTSFGADDVLNQHLMEIKEDGYFLISYNQKILKQSVEREYLKLQRTLVYWLNFSEDTTSYARYNDYINRSALVLKLLSYDKTGAVLAAATTSLPETIGEVRNWDYRFCWLRDASMVIKVMSELGHQKVTRRFMNFIINLISDKDEKIQIMYGIHGQKNLTEEILDHLDGYKGSQPVRVGNDAYHQKQLDIYGILLDVIYQQFNMFRMSLENSENLWTVTRSVVKTVARNWKEPDRGIWEIRNDNKHFTFSKVLCWTAIDRAIKIAELIDMTEYVEKWTMLRSEIFDDIMEKAWDEKKQAFTQAYGVADMDAATLLMEPYGFISAKDPKYVATVKRIYDELCKDDLMYRYINNDDFGLPSSSFTICTFWMINALHKIGETKKAKQMFDKLLSYSNHLGLFSEDIDFKTKRLLGNFPQAYSHLALIETAILMSKGELSDEERILGAIH